MLSEARPFRRRRKWDEATALKIRFALLKTLVLALFLLLVFQLWQLQVVKGDYYRERAEHNRLRVLDIPAPRGVMYDREMRLLVRNLPSFTISILPADLPVKVQDQVYERLGRLLNTDPGEIARGVDERRRERRFFEALPIKHRVDRDTAFIIEEHHRDLPGVILEIEPIREYLEGDTLAHLLGYVGPISPEEYDALRREGYRLEDRIGKTGLELSYEEELRGRPGRETVESDVDGRKIAGIAVQEPQPGLSLVLSIDLELQRKMREYLEENMGRSRYGVTIAMKPKTGEILGMVSIPSYDNNLFSGDINAEALQSLLSDPRRPLVNYAVGGRFPPGSIFKLITGSAALQEGVATTRTRILSTGQISIPSQYDPRVIYTFYDYAPLGLLDFYQAIALSSDVYFYYLAGGYREFQGLGIDRLARYAGEFGIGSPTGIDLPGESAGLLPTREWKLKEMKEPWLTGDTYNMAIGQGYVLATPLQMLNVVATVANGGELLRPQLVREIINARGEVVRPFTKKVIRSVPVASENLAAIRQGMREAVRWGTARAVQVPGVEVAGKTGTAESPLLDTRTGEYVTHGWVLAFAPYEDPEIAVVVFDEQGRGNTTAATTAGKILRYYFSRRVLAKAP